MLGVGTWVGLGARRLAGSISVVPAHLSQTATPGSSGLLMSIEPRRILPFMSKKPIICTLAEVGMGNRVTPLAKGDDTKGRVLGRVDKRKPGEREEGDRTLGNLLSTPFSNALRSLSRSIGRLIGREGFVNLEVKGKAWKIDARQGWLLDDGQGEQALFLSRESLQLTTHFTALDRLMRFR